MIDSAGGDHSFELLNIENNNFVLILFMHDLDEVNLKGIQDENLQNLISLSEKNGYYFVGLTNSSTDKIKEFSQKNNINFPIYTHNIDPIKGPFMVRDAVRSNPGLMLIKNGVVLEKWSWRDFPADLEGIKL